MGPANVTPPVAGVRVPLRILVADDDDVLRGAVRGLLRSLGYSVEVVINGREAIEAAAREDFDLVFLDAHMPELGGREAAYLLRQQQSGERRPRIVGLSADSEEAEFSAWAGIDDFLIKPIRLADLVRVTEHCAAR